MRPIAKKVLDKMSVKLKLFALISTIPFVVACSSGDAVSTSELASQGLYSADISDDAKSSIVGSIQHGGSLWSNQTNERRFNWNHAKAEFTPLISVDIDPSGQYAITGGARTLVLWNTLTGQSEGFWNTPGDIKSLAASNDGDFALVGLDDQTARYFDVKNGGIKQTLRTGAVVRTVSLDKSGTLAVTGDDNYNVTLWDIKSGEQLHKWQLSNRIANVTLSLDGKYVFAAAQLGTAKIWSANTGEVVSEISTGGLTSRNITYSKAKFSADNRQILVGGINSSVKLLNILTGDTLKSWTLNKKDKLRPTGSSVLAVAFGSNDKYYAIGSNGLLNILK